MTRRLLKMELKLSDGKKKIIYFPAVINETSADVPGSCKAEFTKQNNKLFAVKQSYMLH